MSAENTIQIKTNDRVCNKQTETFLCRPETNKCHISKNVALSANL
jgi:hypothetical protein